MRTHNHQSDPAVIAAHGVSHQSCLGDRLDDKAYHGDQQRNVRCSGLLHRCDSSCFQIELQKTRHTEFKSCFVFWVRFPILKLLPASFLSPSSHSTKCRGWKLDIAIIRLFEMAASLIDRFCSSALYHTNPPGSCSELTWCRMLTSRRASLFTLVC